MDLVVAGVQDIFAAHAACVHFTLFQGGTILVHRTGFVGIALWYQLVADNTYGGWSYATYGEVLGAYCRWCGVGVSCGSVGATKMVYCR